MDSTVWSVNWYEISDNSIIDRENIQIDLQFHEIDETKVQFEQGRKQEKKIVLC